MDTDTTALSLEHLELPRLQAIVELMYLAAFADGVVSPEERAVFRDHVSASTRGQLTASVIEAMLVFIENTLLAEPRDSRLENIRARLPDERMRLAAIELIIRVVRADNVVQPSESGFLLRAAAALEIPRDLALERLRLSYASQA